ncbi:hypothetical protein PF005_g22715 [Phytophthora fragariae]|uniref:Uncharacterized protein n=1 Tax=Phytophthora fragariae TaxID=53985 RepID=A0A6A3RQK3_9STRA|nr:hypothetical protein PF003_g14118 [Phytophthora fragariae]KAE8943359.1 hypothetical protein PF009_g6916 [Phytophthora fragariae]KAE8982944.1 hypothetical protein PF011_g21401 [Phytophthora fragariae]KAE9081391.1 hypothetical protein PF007_g22677 [Phytophthora fragariae]KAE9101484.1 hypothetical protein PF006_g22659 [Phytophthora fragariae]
MYWRWARPGHLTVTALVFKMTAAVRRQLGHLMNLLLINYPQLLTPGGHSGAVRYATADNTSVQAASRVTADCIFLRADAPDSTPTTALRIDSHQELVTQMQQAVGPTTVLKTVHPHPRLARMSCFWMGQRRWTRPRRHYKAELRKQKHRKGLLPASNVSKNGGCLAYQLRLDSARSRGKGYAGLWGSIRGGSNSSCGSSTTQFRFTTQLLVGWNARTRSAHARGARTCITSFGNVPRRGTCATFLSRGGERQVSDR